jgi:endoglucanase
VIHFSRAGVATGLVSCPNRYMHSPSEMVELEDLENCARLIAAYVKGIEKGADFTR